MGQVVGGREWSTHRGSDALGWVYVAGGRDRRREQCAVQPNCALSQIPEPQAPGRALARGTPNPLVFERVRERVRERDRKWPGTLEFMATRSSAPRPTGLAAREFRGPRA